MIKLAVAIVGMVFLSGCAITGEPRSENVVYNGDDYTIQNDKFRDSISVGEVSDFPGTGHFTYGGRLAPNFSDKSFKEALELSLKNVSLYGEDYNLDAKLIDSGDWSDWFESSLGEKSRKIKIEYTLKQSNGNTLFSKTIESEVVITNNNPLMPYNITQREAAEKSYAENIRLVIEEINKI